MQIGPEDRTVEIANVPAGSEAVEFMEDAKIDGRLGPAGRDILRIWRFPIFHQLLPNCISVYFGPRYVTSVGISRSPLQFDKNVRLLHSSGDFYTCLEALISGSRSVRPGD